MRVNKRDVILAIIAAGSLVNLALGYSVSSPLAVGAGAVGLIYVVIWLVSVRLRRHPKTERQAAQASPPPIKRRPEPVDPNDTGALVSQMLAEGRHALLLRPQVAENLDETQFRGALASLEEKMALVPDGEVVLGRIDDALDDGKLEDEEIVDSRGRVVAVEHFFLDRHPVTNREYYEFVAADGYRQMPLWDQLILPALLEFVDTTGEPGPRFWRNGCYLAGEENHPVIGVCWFEAVAYARWLGKRLPTDAEWVKAGSWPVRLSETTRLMRKYPWGDTMDRAKANLWGAGPKAIAPVSAFSAGVSVGGVYQLIGNVWEWTRGNYNGLQTADARITSELPLKNIRGGAFDTYFDNQATCQFESGESPIARKHNIGFRCVVGVCDLLLARRGNQSTVPADLESEPVEEVSV